MPPVKKTPKKIPDIITLATDARALGLSLSPYQTTLLKAIKGDLLSKQEYAIWRHCTQRAKYPAHAFEEVTVICGARSGKDSRIMVPLVVHAALFGNHEATGDPERQGEPVVIPIIAQDQRAAKGVAFAYLKAAFERPMLKPYVDSIQSQTIKLKNGISLEVFSSTAAAVRGYSIPFGVLDEVAFWSLEGAEDSDVERQAAVRRGMLAFTSPTCLLKISTPYLKSGVLFQDFQRYYGQDDASHLVWKATSLEMNPSLNAARIGRQIADDPARGRREYEAEWLDAVDAFLKGEWIDRVIDSGVQQRDSRVTQNVRYTIAIDASGGRHDEFVCAVVHVEKRGEERFVILDALVAWDGDISREGVVIECANLARRYNVKTVYGDNYAADWVVDAFHRNGLTYRLPEHKMPDETTVKLTASLAYLQLPDLFRMGQVGLLDDPVLVRQLKLLEHHKLPGGGDKITHPSHGHDDRANAFAVAAAVALGGSGYSPPFSGSVPMLIGEKRGGGGAFAGAYGRPGAAVGGQAAWVQSRYQR